MSGRAIQVAAVLAVAVAGALLWQRVAVDEEGIADSVYADLDSFAAQTTWGEPDLSGVWKSEALGARPGQDTFDLATLERLYTAEARARIQALSAGDDPTLRCAPPAFPRAVMLGRPIQIFQKPGFAFVLTEAYPSVRSIPTTARPHTDEQYLYPTYMGDSTAHWNGDTLVVDAISFNGEAWLAGPADRPTTSSTGAWPTSQTMHVVERWRRVDADTLEYQATVEDPNMLTAPWETPTVTFKRQSVDRIEEALCRPEDGTETYLERLGALLQHMNSELQSLV